MNTPAAGGLTITQDAPKLYVGTYAKYNSGSIQGEWVDLTDFSDAESFLEYCKELHSDEEDPEFMFQDYENFPESYYSESMSESELDTLFEFINLDDDDKKMLEMYIDATGYADATLSDAQDKFMGTADSGADFAERMAEDYGEIPKDMPSWICIDWEASWNCNLRHDYNYTTDEDGTMYFFLNH